jgi:hypothetical protein
LFVFVGFTPMFSEFMYSNMSSCVALWRVTEVTKTWRSIRNNTEDLILQGLLWCINAYINILISLLYCSSCISAALRAVRFTLFFTFEYSAIKFVLMTYWRADTFKFFEDNTPHVTQVFCQVVSSSTKAIWKDLNLTYFVQSSTYLGII